MQLTGEHSFDAPREIVWNFLMDPAILEACLPGAEGMTEVGPDEYTATMKVGIAMIKGTFSGKVKISDKVEPSSYAWKSRAVVPQGQVSGAGSLELVEHDGKDRRQVHRRGQYPRHHCPGRRAHDPACRPPDRRSVLRLSRIEGDGCEVTALTRRAELSCRQCGYDHQLYLQCVDAASSSRARCFPGSTRDALHDREAPGRYHRAADRTDSAHDALGRGARFLADHRDHPAAIR